MVMEVTVLFEQLTPVMIEALVQAEAAASEQLLPQAPGRTVSEEQML